MPKMTYPWTCINFKKKAHQSSHQLLTRVATCLWKDVNKGENLEFELWVSQFPVGGSVYGSFFKFPIFHCKRGELNEEKTFPLLQLHCQAVFCLITLGDHRFSPANQQGSTKKKTLYPDSTHGVSTGFCYIQVVCQTCLWRNGCYRIIPCILYTISDLKKNQDSQSIRTPICFYTLIFVASNGLHKIHLPSPQIGFLEPFHRDPLKGCARRRSATAKLVLGIA